ncbi:GNAT family N-acetyltransferase [Clostridium sp. MSJ-11]|uniref:GNAT family N-acetyltransferase n=1 Tax=Clostridium mobile TaxID=2841512 RepID=A0ABS6EG96_9CLOT|nr:GNAT family N-acetyltransferase [Clostridium mobile]MBU5483731.1 GNAT family N-acetyltransferase [Clostridium mobile]
MKLKSIDWRDIDVESIENLKYDNLDECSNLFIAAFNAEPWNDKWNFNTARKRLEDIYKTPNFKGLVYKKHNKIVGVIMGNYEQWYDGFHYNIKEFFIDTNTQKNGIGSKMLRCLEKHLKETGVNVIHLFTSKSDKTEGFYRRNAYEVPDEITMMSKDI